MTVNLSNVLDIDTDTDTDTDTEIVYFDNNCYIIILAKH